MGAGDDLMATGMAKGAAARGKRIAFGDGRKIIWGPHSSMVFRGNPNIAPPGSERDTDIEWVRYHKGHRVYNKQNGNHWDWNYAFRPTPGEVYFDEKERALAGSVPSGFVLIEPNVPASKGCAPNKQWPVDRFQEVADYIAHDWARVVQLDYPGARYKLERVKQIHTPTFRDAMAILSRADLYIGSEGGMHHAAAALGVPAVVIFGGFIPPEVTGYQGHTNLTGRAMACGMFNKCQHCIDALDRITVGEVVSAAMSALI